MKIRKKQLRDLQICSKILESAYSKEPYNEKFVKGTSLKYLNTKFKHGDGFVVEKNKKIIGFVIISLSYWSNGAQAIVEEIVIAPDLQGKGYGKAVMELVNKYLAKKKVKSVMLWVNKNSKALDFHKKNGFEVADDFVVMFKNL